MQTTARPETQLPQPPSAVGIRRVLLLPGIWMPAWSMLLLERRLNAAGFSARRWAYNGVRGKPGETQDRLREALFHADAVVAHSLGGLMTLAALRGATDLPVQRVVCLGSPLNGSGVARALHARGMSPVLGASGDFLRQGCPPSWPVPAEVGMIAGSMARGVGRLVGGVSDINDGTVTVEETRWGGLTDHLVLPVSHSGLPLSRSVAEQSAHFLCHGRFLRPAGSR